MTRSFVICLTLLSLGGCVRERFRPVATAREMGSEDLACQDTDVFLGPDGAWGQDPLGDGESYLVRGCGSQAWYRCSPAFTRGGACARMPLGPYVSPHESEPHAVLVMDLRSQRLGAGTREMLVLGEEGFVMRQSDRVEAAIPVRPGPIEIGWGAQPMRIEHQRHSRLRTYGYSTYVEYYTTQQRVADEGCLRSFHLDPQPGSVYRLQLDFAGPGQCQLRCSRETIVGGQVSHATCEGFSTL